MSARAALTALQPLLLLLLLLVRTRISAATSAVETADVGADPGHRAGAFVIRVDPVNGAALGAGYKRVATTGAMTGDPDASFLFLKITGDLGSGMGDRMPLIGKKVSRGFRDIIELWILAGAPETGWVAGTDQ